MKEKSVKVMFEFTESNKYLDEFISIINERLVLLNVDKLIPAPVSHPYCQDKHPWKFQQ